MNRRSLLQGLLATATLAWVPLRSPKPALRTASECLGHTMTLDEYNCVILEILSPPPPKLYCPDAIVDARGF